MQHIFYRVVIVVAVIVTTCFGVPAEAPASPLTVSPELRRALAAGRIESKAAALLGADVPRVGRVYFLFPRRNEHAARAVVDDGVTLRPEISEALLLRGEAILPARGSRNERFERVPAAASVIAGTTGKTLRIHFARANHDRKTVRFYELSVLIAPSLVGEPIIREVSSYALSGHRCGASELISGAGSAAQPRSARSTLPRAAATTKVLNLITDCDLECSNALGSNANQRILDFANTENSIYESDLGLSINVVNQTRRTTSAAYPSSYTDSEQLLQQLQTVGLSLGTSDLKHLITGKEINGNIIGLSYVATVCFDPTFAVGFSQHFNSLLTPIIMAHEMGHNLGADHDPTGQGVMQASLSPISPPSHFSNFSINQISNFLALQGSCLRESQGSSSSSSSSSSSTSSSQSSSDVRLTVSFKNHRFQATARIPAGFSGCIVTLNGARSARALRLKPVVLATRAVSNKTVRFTATGIRGVRAAIASAVFSASVNCTTGGALASSNMDLSVSGSQATDTIKNVSAWLSRVARKFRQLSGERSPPLHG